MLRGTGFLSDAVMVPGYRTDKRHRRSFAVQTLAEPDSGPGAGDWLRAERVSGYNVMQFCFLNEQELLKTMPNIFVMTGVLAFVHILSQSRYT